MDIQFTKNEVYDLYKEGKILKTENKTHMNELYISFSPQMTKSDNRFINEFLMCTTSSKIFTIYSVHKKYYMGISHLRRHIDDIGTKPLLTPITKCLAK